MGVTLLLFVLMAEPFPDGPGKEAFASVCSLCHDPSHVAGKQWTKAEWNAKVLEMLQEETDVSQADRDAIVDYLAKNFGKKVNVNKAPVKELAAVLELSAKEAEAIVQSREKGSFKTVDDLKKVPGIDPAKFDANKSRLEF